MSDILERIATMFARSHGADRDGRAFVNNVVHPWLDRALPHVSENGEAESVFRFPTETIDRVQQGLGSFRAPTNARLYARAMMGDVRPVSNEDLSQDELDFIRQLAERSLGEDSSRGAVTYLDYDEMLPERIGVASLVNSPVAKRVQTTLGQFVTHKDDDGTVRVVDRYNFNPNHTRYEGREQLIRMLSQSQPEGAWPPPERNLYDFLRLAGEVYGPRGGRDVSGMPVELVFPPKEPE